MLSRSVLAVTFKDQPYDLPCVDFLFKHLFNANDVTSVWDQGSQA